MSVGQPVVLSVAGTIAAEFSRPGGHGRTVTRGWVIWHLIEHELQHDTEIALVLSSHGPPTLDI
jgi:uncharacterized damage-inducible protein DinB